MNNCNCLGTYSIVPMIFFFDYNHRMDISIQNLFNAIESICHLGCYISGIIDPFDELDNKFGEFFSLSLSLVPFYLCVFHALRGMACYYFLHRQTESGPEVDSAIDSNTQSFAISTHYTHI